MLFSDPANIGEVKQKDHKFKAYLGILVRPVFWSSLYLLFLASTTCFVIIYFYYMGILPLCMSIYHMDARYPERPEYSIKSPGTKVTKHFEVSDRSRELIVIWSSGGVASAFNHWTISPSCTVPLLLWLFAVTLPCQSIFRISSYHKRQFVRISPEQFIFIVCPRVISLKPS